MRLAPNLGWVDVPLGDMVREALVAEFGSSPTVADRQRRRPRCRSPSTPAASARTARNLIYLSGEVGIGGGIIIDGRPMAGAGGYGGEVGHMVGQPRRRRCAAAARRAAGRPRSAATPSSRTPGLGGEQVEVADVIAAASAGDRKAQAAIDEAGEWLGIGLANLVNLFNPEVIVLGGHLRLLFPLVSGTVYRRIHYALPGDA